MAAPNRVVRVSAVVLSVLLGLGLVSSSLASIRALAAEPRKLEKFMRGQDSSCLAVRVGGAVFSLLDGVGMIAASVGFILLAGWGRWALKLAVAFALFASAANIAYRQAVLSPLIAAYMRQLPPRDPNVKNCGFGVVLRDGAWDGFVGQFSNTSGVLVDLIVFGVALIVLVLLLGRFSSPAAQSSRAASHALRHLGRNEEAREECPRGLPLID